MSEQAARVFVAAGNCGTAANRHWAAAFLALALLCMTGSWGKPVEALSGNIHPAPYGQHDAVVFLTVSENGSYYYCSGVLITSRVVLTAAHCLTMEDTENHPEKEDISIWSGDISNPFDPKNSPTTRLIARQAVKIILHPKYVCCQCQDWFKSVDLGIIVLPQGAARGIVPYPVSGELPKINGEVVLVGYGLTKNGQQRELFGIRHYGYSTIREAAPRESHTKANYFMVQGEAMPQSVDSGGPALMRDASTSQLRVVGIDRGGYPDREFYARVASQSEWIGQIIRQYAETGELQKADGLQKDPTQMNAVHDRVDQVTVGWKHFPY